MGNARNVYISSWGGGGGGGVLIEQRNETNIFASNWTTLNAMGTGNEGF